MVIKKNYLFLLFSIFITTELHGFWWQRVHPTGIGRLFSVIAVLKKHPIIGGGFILLIGGILFQWQKRFKQTIWEAIRNDDAKVVRYYLKLNPRIVYELNSAGNTPLHFAVACNQPDIIKILLERNPFLINYQPVIASRVFSEADSTIYPIEIKSGTPLFVAVEYDNKDAIKYLILKGADINASNDFVGSPLNRARQIDVNGGHKMEEFLNQEVAKRLQRR